jgi:hypothetical protein
MKFNSMTEELGKLAYQMNQQKETYILSQLNELISRGLLVIHQTEPTLTREENSNQIKVSQQIRLVLKDQEYVEKLEAEIAQLRSQLKTITDVLNAGGTASLT